MTYQIIRTKQDLDALHPKAILACPSDSGRYDRVFLAEQILPQHDLPAVVVCPSGDPIRAARKALEAHYDHET